MLHQNRDCEIPWQNKSIKIVKIDSFFADVIIHFYFYPEPSRNFIVKSTGFQFNWLSIVSYSCPAKNFKKCSSFKVIKTFAEED
jgi:hypothetical protein